MSTIVIVAADETRIPLSKRAACLTRFFQTLLETDPSMTELPLQHITTPTIFKIVDYLTYHVDSPAPPIPSPLLSADLNLVVSEYDYEFITECDQTTLFELMVSANYLQIPSLLELTQARVASMMFGKSPDEISHIFGIQDDITPGEEREVIAKYEHLLN